ncbi:MAG: ornithine carbamoyltransferase [Balneolales bacterium]|nr:ornithine carbamoyltransferase [Balneolales bacterium]
MIRNLLKISDHSKDFLQYLLDMSANLQTQKTVKPLDGASILFCFEKPSLRTKLATEVAINQLGGSVIHISPEEFLGGKILHATENEPGIPEEREALKDTVKNVAQWCEGIFARVYSHETLQKLAGFSDIPIVSGLCEKHHPMQALADLYTIHEFFGAEKPLHITFVGDANNVAFSLIEIGLIFGHTMQFAGPNSCYWSYEQLTYFGLLASCYGGSFRHGHNPAELVQNADVVYTDAFISMGQEHEYAQKLRHFDGYQVNEELFALAPSHARFMHCLPAHRGIEVTDDVIDSPNSLVYQQAKNRMVTAKGVFAVLCNSGLSKKAPSHQPHHTMETSPIFTTS